MSNSGSDNASPIHAGLLAALTAVGVASAGYSLLVEPYRLQTVHVDIPLQRLPPELDGVTILLLADSHISRMGLREQMLADVLQSLPTPDIAVLAGDLIEGAKGIPVAADLVRRHVRARYARYAIFGNAEHKIKGPRRRAFRHILEEAGVQVLVNQCERLLVRDVPVTVAGTDDPYYGHADLPASLRGSDPDSFRLLLAHSPQIVRQAARAGVDLVLSGHTHGGQVRLPLLGALKTQNPLGRTVDMGLFDRERLRNALGHDVASDIMLYISRGIGVAPLNRIPIYPRFLCRPEVTWITLRHGPSRLHARSAPRWGAQKT